MNNLSWMLYLADVLPSFAGALGAVCVITIIGYCIARIVCIADRFEWRFAGYWLPTAALATALVTALVPSREAIYLIAASEAGEQALESPEMQKARKVINNWLDKQLKGTEKADNAL